MNRRQRRAAGQRPPGPHELEQYAACPDCGSDVVVTEVAPEVFQGEVRHDECCPWFADFERRGGLGVRFVKKHNNNNEGEQ
jgi:transcription elongation factor Elf1